LISVVLCELCGDATWIGPGQIVHEIQPWKSGFVFSRFRGDDATG
jgi:hypothetical protein